MLERHSNKRATWRWRSLSAPLSQLRNGTGEDVREKSSRTRTFRCLRTAILWQQSTRRRGCPLSARPSCGSPLGYGQGEKGELQGEVRQSLQPWLSPPETCQTLQKQPGKGSSALDEKQEQLHTGATGADIPSLVTPSSVVSPF